MSITRIITCHWNEPETGQEAFLVTLTLAQWNKIFIIFSWLEANAGDNYDQSLASWHVHDIHNTSCDHGITYEALIKFIKLNSRYDETGVMGELYGGRSDLLDNPGA